MTGDRIHLEPHRRRCAIYMGGGDWFTVWVTLPQFHRAWRRALRRSRFIKVDGVHRYALNPHQVTLVEGRKA